jgi:hypothetical protein
MIFRNSPKDVAETARELRKVGTTRRPRIVPTSSQPFFSEMFYAPERRAAPAKRRLILPGNINA